VVSKKNQVDFAEPIPPLLGEIFLDPVLGAARGVQNPDARLFFERLAQECHRPMEAGR